MKEKIKNWRNVFSQRNLHDEALEYFKDNEYKIELINEIVERKEK